MKKKRLFFLVMVIALVSSLFFSCDAINEAIDSTFMKVETVEPADLANFTGDSPAAGSDDDIMYGFGEALGLLTYATPISRALGDDYTELVKVLDAVVPGLAEAADARTVSASITASITDESITSDYEAGDYSDPGDITITTAEVSAKSEVNSMTNPTESTAEFDLDIEVTATDIIDYDQDPVTYEYTVVDRQIEEATINVKAKGNATAVLETQTMEGYTLTIPTSVDFYLACDASLGVSFSSDEGYSGKYVVNFNYVAAAVLTEADYEAIASGDTSILGEDFTLEVELYNNSGTLVDSVDVMEWLEENMAGSTI